MIQDILDNPLFECPAEEVELAHRRLFDWFLTAHLEADAFTTAKGIKEPLRIRLELALIMKMHHELRGLLWVADVELL